MVPVVVNIDARNMHFFKSIDDLDKKIVTNFMILIPTFLKVIQLKLGEIVLRSYKACSSLKRF